MHGEANTNEVVVVGGGLGGLLCAGLLAQRGHEVRVLERAEQLGGRGRSHERAGYRFDMGAHALYRSHAHALLGQLGVSLRGRAPRAARGRVWADDRDHALPANTRTLLTSSALSLRGKLSMARLLARVREPASPELAGMSVAEWIERELPGPDARRLVGAVIGLASYCRELDRLSADAGYRQLQASLAGVLYLDEGWSQIVERLEQAVLALGVRIERGRGVRAIEQVEGHWRVRCDDAEHRCRAVVLAIPPTSAAKLLRSAGLEPTWSAPLPVRAACLDLGLRGPWTAPDLVLDLDAPIYMTSPSQVCERAPKGSSTVALIWYRRACDDATPPTELRRRLEAMLERFVPDFRARIEAEQFLPDIDVTFDRPRPELGGLAGRAKSEQAPGLFLVGDWVGEQALLLDASAASAAAVVERIAGVGSYSNSRRRAS